jgi:hypothetical protein
MSFSDTFNSKGLCTVINAMHCILPYEALWQSTMDVNPQLKISFDFVSPVLKSKVLRRIIKKSEK